MDVSGKCLVLLKTGRTPAIPSVYLGLTLMHWMLHCFVLLRVCHCLFRLPWQRLRFRRPHLALPLVLPQLVLRSVALQSVASQQLHQRLRRHGRLVDTLGGRWCWHVLTASVWFGVSCSWLVHKLETENGFASMNRWKHLLYSWLR